MKCCWIENKECSHLQNFNYEVTGIEKVNRGNDNSIMLQNFTIPEICANCLKAMDITLRRNK